MIIFINTFSVEGFMGESKLVLNKDFLTEKANVTEMNYRDKSLEEYQDYINNFYAHARDGKLEYLPFINKRIKVKGKVIELGAGICWLSSELSKIKDVNEVYSLEFSEYLLKDIAPGIMKKLNAEEEKITRVQGDFNSLPFEENKFDFAFIDAALHHATDLSHMLKEIKRVLKPGGIIIAIREPVLPTWRPWCKDKFGEHDKANGITENIYSLKEWKIYFNSAGLETKMIPFMPKSTLYRRLLQPLMIFNNQLLGHFIMVAKKPF